MSKFGENVTHTQFVFCRCVGNYIRFSEGKCLHALAVVFKFAAVFKVAVVGGALCSTSSLSTEDLILVC